MSKQDNLTDFLVDVADAIREKKGTTEKINPQYFSNEIRSIESGGIIEDKSIYGLSLPANYGVVNRGQGQATSEEYYTFDTLPIVNLVVKYLRVGNIFSTVDIITLRKDADNYLSMFTQGYELRFELVINKSVLKSVVYGQTDDIWKALTLTLSWVITIDRIMKRFVIKTKNYNGTNDSTFVIDMTDWELDLLGEFQVVTEIGKVYYPYLGSKYFVFNRYIASNDYLDTMLLSDNYSPFKTFQNGTDVEINNLTAVVGGTKIETISPAHAVHSYDIDSSNTYFALGCSAQGEYGADFTMATMVKFTEMTKATEIYIAAGSKLVEVLDENLGLVCRLSSGSTPFSPEMDKWYIMVATAGKDRNIGYTSLYAYMMKGAGKVEVKALYVSNTRTASIGSINWNGEYFTGYIPFKGENIKFESITEEGNGTPLYSLRIKSGQVQMWTGSEWKQITN